MEVESQFSIEEFKEVVESVTGVDPVQQRLVYAGKILAFNHQTLEQLGIKDEHTVYLVKVKQASPPSSAAQMIPQPVVPKQDPLMSSLMKSPMMKSLLSNPEVLKGLLLSNPQMKAMVEKNPQIAKMFDDPDTLRDMFEMSTNPNYQKEMLKNHDRALQNLDLIPEGRRALVNMYNTLQEPMYESLQSGQQSQEIKTSEIKKEVNVSPLPNPWSQKKSPKPQPERRAPRPLTPHSPSINRSLLETLTLAHQEHNSELPFQSFTAPTLAPTQSDADYSTHYAKYESELKQLEEMGFCDRKANIKALLAAGGNIYSALELLLQNM